MKLIFQVNLSETKWTGKEDIDEYIKKEEYTIEPMIYLGE